MHHSNSGLFSCFTSYKCTITTDYIATKCWFDSTCLKHMYACLDPTHKTLVIDCSEGKTDRVTFYAVTLLKCPEIGWWPVAISCNERRCMQNSSAAFYVQAVTFLGLESLSLPIFVPCWYLFKIQKYGWHSIAHFQISAHQTYSAITYHSKVHLVHETSPNSKVHLVCETSPNSKGTFGVRDLFRVPHANRQLQSFCRGSQPFLKVIHRTKFLTVMKLVFAIIFYHKKLWQVFLKKKELMAE